MKPASRLDDLADRIVSPPWHSNEGRDNEQRTPRKNIVIRSAAEFLAHEYPPQEFCIEPWLPTQGAALVYAKAGVGKTQFALSAAVALASGKPFIKWSVPKPRSVFFLDGEMPATLLQQRLAMYLRMFDAYEDLPLKIHSYEDQESCIDLSLTEDQDRLEPHLADSSLVIVDNVSSLCRTGKENEAESWRPMQSWILRQRARGRSVLLVDHANKGGGNRGTSKKSDVLDTLIRLEQPLLDSPDEGARFELHFEKNRGFFGADTEALDICLKEDMQGKAVWEWQTVQASTYERTIAAHRDGVEQKDMAEYLGISKTRVSRHLKRARDEGRVR